MRMVSRALSSCRVEGCSGPQYKRCLCNRHYEEDKKGRKQLSGDICAVAGCSGSVHAKSLCASHYNKWKTYGDPLFERVPADVQICKIEGCSQAVKALGMCKLHYGRDLKERRRASGKLMCELEGCSSPVHLRRMCHKHYERWLNYGDALFEPPRPQRASCLHDGCCEDVVAKSLCRHHYNEARLQRGVVCSVEGCHKPALATRSVCAMHAAQARAARLLKEGVLCSVDDCSSPVRAKGLCNAHYQRLIIHGDPLHEAVKQRNACSVDGCDREARSSGLCHTHYQRQWKYGDPLYARVVVKEVCSIAGCYGPVKSRELCAKHYAAAFRKGGLTDRKCEVEGCCRTVFSRGLCSRHHAQWWLSTPRGRGGQILRHAVTRGARGEFIDPFDIFERDGWHCQICGVNTPRHLSGFHTALDAPVLDHIQPIILGGAHVAHNVQLLCLSCNSSKHDHLQGFWATSFADAYDELMAGRNPIYPKRITTEQEIESSGV